MSMLSSTLTLPLGLLGVGIVIIFLELAWLVGIMKIKSMKTFAVQVAKLVESENIERARKLCGDRRHALVSLGTDRLLQAHQQGDADPALLRDAFDRGVRDGELLLNKLVFVTPLGILIAVAGVAIAYLGNDGAQLNHFIAAFAVLFLAVYSYWTRFELRATARTVRDALVEKLTSD